MINPRNLQFRDTKLLSFCGPFTQKGGHWIDIETHKVTKIKHVDWNSPWHHINPDHERAKCGKLRFLVKAKSFIPKFCLSCWKVCVTPRTLRELYDLRDIMFEMVEDNPRCFCKCGTEHRDHTPGKIYGGYFYTNSYEIGVERYKTVRRKISERISPDVDVVLKRYCTEFEVLLGPSDKYERPSNADAVEDMYLNIVEMDVPRILQPDFALLETYSIWMHHGWRWGTKEDRRQIEIDHNEGMPLYPVPKTYNPEG